MSRESSGAVLGSLIIIIMGKDAAKASSFRPDDVRARARARARARKLGGASMSVVDSLRLARAVLEKTRAKQQVDKCLGAGAKRRNVVSQIWSRAVSNTHSDLLSADLSFGRKDRVLGAQGNWRRACTPNAALRKAFKQIDATGSTIVVESCFGVGDTLNTNISCQMLAAATALAEQRKEIDRIVSGKGKLIRVTWEMDSTPQRVGLQEAETISALVGHKLGDVADSGGVHDVLVQRCTMCSDTMLQEEQVIVPPKILGDTSSSTELDALLFSMFYVGLSLEVLAAAFETVLFFVGTDGASPCLLMVDYLRCAMRALPNVQVVWNATSTCLMHSLNRITADHFRRDDSGYSLSGMTTLSKIFCVSRYWDLFCSGVLDESVAVVNWQQYGGPPPGAADALRKWIRFVMPGLDSKPKVMAALQDLLAVINGSCTHKAVPHCCILDSSGRPCCQTLAQVKRKIRVAVRNFLLAHKPQIPCTTRWLTVLPTCGFWVVGMLVCNLYSRGFLRAFAGVSTKPSDDDTESTEDSYAVMMGKRMRRGKKAMVDILWHFSILISLIILHPLHTFMSVVLACSSDEACTGGATPMCDIMDAANATGSFICELLRADVHDGSGRWGLLHVCEAAIPSDFPRAIIRRDLHRAYGGLNMRAFRPMASSPDWQLFVVLETPYPGFELRVARAKRVCQYKSCCRDVCYQGFLGWCRTASTADLIEAKKTYRPWIIRTERDHGGNQKAERGKQGKARSWRRQVSNYVCRLSKTRWKRSACVTKDSRHLSGQSLKVIQLKTKASTSRAGIGGNAMMGYVNRKLDELRGHGAGGRLDNERSMFAREYDAQLPEQRGAEVTSFRAQQAQRRAQLQQEARTVLAEAQRDSEADSVKDPSTHFGMGTRLYPVTVAALEECLREHNPVDGVGFRRAADACLPELDLIAKPACRRLQLPKGFRSTCHWMHRGLCRSTPDAEYKMALAAQRNIGKFEKVTEAGSMILRFCRGGNSVKEDLHFAFSSLRMNPKYHAEYTLMHRDANSLAQDGDHFPFLLTDSMLDTPPTGITVNVCKDYVMLEQMTSWQMSLYVVKACYYATQANTQARNQAKRSEAKRSKAKQSKTTQSNQKQAGQQACRKAKQSKKARERARQQSNQTNQSINQSIN